MTEGSTATSRLGARLIVLFGAPLLVWVSWIGFGHVLESRDGPETGLRVQATRLQESFDRLLDDAEPARHLRVGVATGDAGGDLGLAQCQTKA